MSKNTLLTNPKFWLLAFSSVTFMASFNMIVPELNTYLRSLGGEDYIGWIISLFTLSAAISVRFSGIITDKLGRIPVMVFGSIVCILISLLYPFVLTVGGFLILRFFHGFSTGFKPTGSVAYLADITDKSKRGEAMGYMGVAGSIGMSLGPFFGSYIANLYGINTMFYTSSFIGLVSLLIILGLKETLTEKEPFSWKWFSLKEILYFEKEVLKPSLVMLLTVITFGIVLTAVPDKSDVIGLENRGTFFLISVSTSMIIRFFGGKASDKYGRLKMLIFGIFLLIISFTMLGYSYEKYTFLVAASFHGASMGLVLPAIFAWTVDVASIKKRGQAMSSMYFAREIGIMLGSLLSGYIITKSTAFMSINIVFYIGASLAFISLIYVSYLYKNDNYEK